MLFPRCVTAVVAAVIALPSAGSTISLGAVRDTTLYESATGALANGSGQFLFAGTTNQPLRRRALLAFDVASVIPQGAIIESVTVRLHLASASSQFHMLSLSRMTSNWGEGASDAAGNEGSGAAAMNGDATWIHSFLPGVMWNTAGGDFAATISAATEVGDIGYYSWTSAQLAQDVRDWIANPESAFGWILRGDEVTPGSARRFDSSEGTNAQFAPSLEVEYSFVPAPPAAIAMLVAGAMFSRRRDRKGGLTVGMRPKQG